MKFFVTGRSNNYERVKQAFDLIENRGYQVTLRWTDLPMIKPYQDNQETAGKYSSQQMKGVIDADIYILFAHEDGNGVFTEFGAALVLHEKEGKPFVYAIGDERVKAKAMFHYHPAIKWRDSVEEIVNELEK